MILEHIIQDMVAIRSDLLKEKAPDPYSNKGSKYAARVLEAYVALKSEIEPVLTELESQTKKMQEDFDYLISDRKYVDRKVVEKLRAEDRTAKGISDLAQRLVTAYDELYRTLQVKKEMIPIYEEDFALGCKLRAMDGILPMKSASARNKVADNRDAYAKLDSELGKVLGEIDAMESLDPVEEILEDELIFQAVSGEVPHMEPEELGLKLLGPDDTNPYIPRQLVPCLDPDFIA